MLTPEQAAPLVGVPAAQLTRWAWDRVGPKNSGTRWKPKFREEDLREWLEKRAARFSVRYMGQGQSFMREWLGE